jgi:hypothetical protein
MIEHTKIWKNRISEDLPEVEDCLERSRIGRLFGKVTKWKVFWKGHEVEGCLERSRDGRLFGKVTRWKVVWKGHEVSVSLFLLLRTS